MPGDLAPVFTVVITGKNRACIGPEVNSCSFAPVRCHCLAQDREVAIALGKAAAHGAPAIAAIAAAPYRCRGLWRVTALRITIERYYPDRFGIMWVNRNGKAECRWKRADHA